MQPRTRKPLTDLSSNNNININQDNTTNSNSFRNSVNRPQSKSLLINPQRNENLSNPFQSALNITPKAMNDNNQNKKNKYDSDSENEDDDLKKALNFKKASLVNTPKQVVKTQSISQSMSPSPGVINNKQNIASPQRIPSISLRSFHTINHVEFYKPIPISQSRSTQFEIVNETYDDKSIQILKKYENITSCITISPTAINIKRNDRALITITCTPYNAMRIKEIIRIEWDLHSIEIQIHAVGFEKSMRNKKIKKKKRERGYRKRSLENMRNEDNEKCNSIQSSLESSIASSNSSTQQNSAQLRRRRRSRRPILSPTIRREKSFTAAPFSSPAPSKIRRNFMFSYNNNNNYNNNNSTADIDQLSVVQENVNDTNISFTPKEFKKRRVIHIDNNNNNNHRKRLSFQYKTQNKEIQQTFERLCGAVIPIQALFRCYLTQKNFKKLLKCKQIQQRQNERQQYYFGVIKSQLITKRVRKMYLRYKTDAIIIQSSIKTYCIQKNYNEYIYQLQLKQKEEQQRIERIRAEKEEKERIYKEEQERIRIEKGKKEKEEQERIKKQREEMERKRIEEEQERIRKEKEEEERKRKEEEERRRKEEEKRRRKEEEERRRKEEEERKRKEEEERRRKEEEERKKKEEEERRRKEEEERRRKEEEEKKRKEEEERQRIKEEIERKRKEEILRKQREEKARLERERIRKKEEEERLRKEREEMLRKQREKEAILSEFMCSMIYCKRTRMQYLTIQQQLKEEARLKREKEERLSQFICPMIRCKRIRNQYLMIQQQRKEEERLKRETEERLSQFMCSMIHCKRIRIQYLAIQQQRKEEERLKREKEAMVTQFMCTMLDCNRTRIKYLRIKRPIVVLQSAFRTYIARKQYHKQRGVIFIQSYIRGKLWRIKYLSILKQIEIEKQKKEQKRQCVEGLLSLWRLHKFRKMVNEKRREIAMQNKAAIYIQSWFKGTMIRKEYKKYLQEHNKCYIDKVILIQALIRGKLKRMEYVKNNNNNNNNNKLLDILKRVYIANINWRREDTVNYLLQSALSKLTKSRTLYGVCSACDTLESLLKLVPNISDRIVEHNIVGALYNILRNSNRSLPHLNLVNKILNFFLFFAKHDIKCYQAIFYRDDTLDILSERLQIHRLDFVLFELTTKLFFIGVDIDNNKELESNNKFLINLRKSDVNRQIRTVQKIMISKLEIAKRVNKPLKKIKDANIKYKVKFEQERILSKCVENMNHLVDKL